MSFAEESGKSPFPTLTEKATPLLICLPITGTPSILAFMLIVCTPLR
ncbi:hypothetical protein LINPERHAP1_LOCUS284 [Linum perenne]